PERDPDPRIVPLRQRRLLFAQLLLQLQLLGCEFRRRRLVDAPASFCGLTPGRPVASKPEPPGDRAEQENTSDIPSRTGRQVPHGPLQEQRAESRERRARAAVRSLLTSILRNAHCL